MKRQIEIFTAGCPVCEPVVIMVKEEASESCHIAICNLADEFDNLEVKEKLKRYGVNRIPAVAVDGVLLGCCTNNTVSRDELKKAVVAHPLN